MGRVKIGNYIIENGGRPFIIAEAGVNHNGDVELAMRLVDTAVGADADAVKFQTFRTENLVTKTARKVQYQSENMIL